MPDGLPPARDTFAVVAVLLALPDEELDERFEAVLWRQRKLGEPIDLTRLWFHPGDGGAVLRCDRQHVLMAPQDIGVMVALAWCWGTRQSPRTWRPGAASLCRRSVRLPMAQHILTDPANVVRLAAAHTPALRRGLLGRLAREAFPAEEPPATSTRAGHSRVPGQAAL